MHVLSVLMQPTMLNELSDRESRNPETGKNRSDNNMVKIF